MGQEESYRSKGQGQQWGYPFGTVGDCAKGAVRNQTVYIGARVEGFKWQAKEVGFLWRTRKAFEQRRDPGKYWESCLVLECRMSWRKR